MDGREAILPWAGHVDRAGRPCRGRVDAGRRLVRRLQDSGHRPGRPGDQRQQGRAGQDHHRRRAGDQGSAQGRPKSRGQLEDPGELHRRPGRQPGEHSPGQIPEQADSGRLHGLSDQAERIREHSAVAAPLRPHRRRVPVPDEPDAGRRLPSHAIREVQGQAHHQGHPEDDVRGRRGLGRGCRGAPRDQGVPPGTGQVPGRRRQDPQGCAPLRASRYGQDAPRACCRGRGGRSLLLDLGFRLRRDVRRCRCLPGP